MSVKKENSFLKNSILNFSGNIFMIALGLISSVIIARTLGPQLQGVYTLVVLLPTMLVTFMNLGIGPATVYNIGSKKESIKTVIATNIILSSVIGVFSIFIGCIFIYFFKNSIFSGVPIRLLLCVLVIVPFLFLNSFLQAVYQGIQNFKRFNEIQVINKISQVILLIITLLILKLELNGALIAFIISSLFPTFLIYRYFSKDDYKFEINNFSASLAKEYFSYGSKAHLSNIVSFMNYRMDILMISLFLNPYAVGIYNVAVSIGERLWVISSPISSALFPRISSLESENDKTILTVKVTRYVFYLSLIVGVFFFVISPWAVYILFGKEYQEASKVIRILLLGITIFAAERILSNDFAGRGKPQINLYTSLFTVLCNVIANVILIPIYGINGAAAATSLSYSLTFLIKLTLYCKFTGAKSKDILLIKKEDIDIFKKGIKLLRKG
ncbi:flippase [Bhargavaea ginsengi]|uniref:flippase n=1 Tax=Bhargavaea ginsengi TaxID=426757 RepID=UPI00203C7874|nr:flippase [Bhargavaea ginsengi]MCM3088670.1 flippase [Bhargavaea ginsengi]